jgi:hypothetical protein
VVRATTIILSIDFRRGIWCTGTGALLDVKNEEKKGKDHEQSFHVGFML